MATLLVTGGTGTLGRRVLARRPEARVLSRKPGAFVGDLVDGTGVDAALDGVDVILHLASGPAKGLDPRATRTLIDAAARAGTRPHLIYTSIVGIDRVPLPYYRDKLASERLVQDSALPWTIIRATQFHSLLYALFAAVKGPFLPGPIGLRFQPVDPDDVAARLLELAAGPAQGRVDDLGGPQIREARDLARAYLRATGRRKLLVPLPLPGRLAAAVRAGALLAPDHAAGRVTFEEYLTRRAARRT